MLAHGIFAALRRFRFRQAARWSPLAALAAGYWLEDPDLLIRVVTVSSVLTLIGGMEFRDWQTGRPGPGGKLKLVPQCGCHEIVHANSDRIDGLESETGRIRATVRDWDQAFSVLAPRAPAAGRVTEFTRSGRPRHRAG